MINIQSLCFNMLASLAWSHKVSLSEISSDNFTFLWRHLKLESLRAHSAETTPQHRKWWYKLVDWVRPSKVIRVLLMCMCVHVRTMNQSFNLAADEAANNPAETGRRREQAVRCEAEEDHRLNYNVHFLLIKWIFQWLLIISRSQI